MTYPIVFCVFVQQTLLCLPAALLLSCNSYLPHTSLLSLHSGPSRSVMDGCKPRPRRKPNLERGGVDGSIWIRYALQVVEKSRYP